MAQTHSSGPLYEASGIKQPYHLVDPSPWPLVGALAAGLLAGGMVLFMHGHGYLLLALGALAVLGTMAVWWRDVISESVEKHLHTPVVKIGLRYGMALFIASEVMFFSAFFWAYFDGALFYDEAIQAARVQATGGVWPPKGTLAIDPFDMPLMMTVILLLSGTTVTWAHHAVLEGKQSQAVQALVWTVLLGIMFTGFQAYEYVHAPFGFKDNIFSGAFFMATGFHGFHVMIGTIFLAVCLFRAKAGHFTPKSHFGLEAAAWYWHFVDVVWLFLFVSIYWWGSHNAVIAHH
jgi:cytochrome c oxidase subunit 3